MFKIGNPDIHLNLKIQFPLHKKVSPLQSQNGQETYALRGGEGGGGDL
jgi:hypothetical protein